jgi:hypothetical protein
MTVSSSPLAAIKNVTSHQLVSFGSAHKSDILSFLNFDNRDYQSPNIENKSRYFLVRPMKKTLIHFPQLFASIEIFLHFFMLLKELETSLKTPIQSTITKQLILANLLF